MATLSTATSEKKTVRHVVEVVRSPDNQIGIPDGMTLEQVDTAIHSRMEYNNKVIALDAEIDAPFVYEALAALHATLTELYGWATVVNTPGFFGETPPTMLNVPLGPDETVQVPFGRFTVPNIEGHLQTSVRPKGFKDGEPLVLVINGEIKRRDEEQANKIIAAVRDRVRNQSIYRGTAFSVRLTDDNNMPLPFPEPHFKRLDSRTANELILPEATQRSVDANLFAPIEYTAACRARGIPLKRGVLLAGPFGTGKTMVAHSTALKAVANGWTYIEVEKIIELADVVRLARYYQPVVVFCEDIDRLMRGDERSIGVDEILNVVDGVDSKGTDLMVVFTTNELDKIQPPMLRPGRLDAIIHIGPPDADAADRLVRQYGKGIIVDDDPLTRSREALAGKIPAVIREAVERSKLYAISLNGGDGDLRVSDEALFDAVKEMDTHVALLTPKEKDLRSETVKAADRMAEAIEFAAEKGVPVWAGLPRGESVFAGDVVFDGIPIRTNSEHGAKDDMPGLFPDSQSKTSRKAVSN